MDFLKYVLANWDSIIAVVAIIVISIVCFIKQEKSIIFKMLYVIVTEAEKQYGSGTGELKLASAMSAVYEKLPAVIRTVLPAKVLENWVETALAEAKKKWAANANIATYIATESSETAEVKPEN